MFLAGHIKPVTLCPDMGGNLKFLGGLLHIS